MEGKERVIKKESCINLLVISWFFAGVSEHRDTKSCKDIICVQNAQKDLNEIGHHIIPSHIGRPVKKQ